MKNKQQKTMKRAANNVKHDDVHPKDVRRLAKMLARYDGPKVIVEVLHDLCIEAAGGQTNVGEVVGPQAWKDWAAKLEVVIAQM